MILFQLGCFVAYRSQLGGDSLKGLLCGGVLIFGGLVLGYWQRL
jgi:hypothetical protein